MSTDAELERIVLVTMEGEKGSLSFGEIRSLCDTVHLQDVLDALLDRALVATQSARGKRPTYRLTSKGQVEAKRIMRRWPKHLRGL